MYCRDVYPVSERGQLAVCYPGLTQGIHDFIQKMLRTHFETCWEDAAKRLELMDTQRGIYFRWNSSEPMPEEYKNSAEVSGLYRNGRISVESDVNEIMSSLNSVNIDLISGENESNTADQQVVTSEGDAEGKDSRYDLPALTANNPELMEEDDYDLVLPEDEPLISDYLYLSLRQMRPCLLNNADLVGCYKDRETGFRGLACKHCIGQAGCGRYFPASEKSLSQTTTSHTIFNHVRNCRRVPIDIRNELELMKKGQIGPRPKHGGRKVFFNRLWCRIQGLEIVEETPPSSVKEKKKKANNQSSHEESRSFSEVEIDDESDDHDKPTNKIIFDYEERNSELVEPSPHNNNNVIRRRQRKRINLLSPPKTRKKRKSMKTNFCGNDDYVDESKCEKDELLLLQQLEEVQNQKQILEDEALRQTNHFLNLNKNTET